MTDRREACRREVPGPALAFSPPVQALWPQAGLPSLPHERNCAWVTLPGSLESCGQARRFTVTVLSGWGLEALAGDALTVASELVSNAVIHATDHQIGPSFVELAWWWRPRRDLTCIVTDPDSRAPVLRRAGVLAESGRGLQVVRMLAFACGWTPCPGGGKAVWASISLPPAFPGTGRTDGDSGRSSPA